MYDSLFFFSIPLLTKKKKKQMAPDELYILDKTLVLV